MTGGKGNQEGSGERQRAIREGLLRALRELPLDEATVGKVARRLLDSNLLVLHPPRLRPDTTLLRFRAKADRVVGRFAAEGLTFEAYLKAAVRHPRLLLQNPDTVIAHVEAVAARFSPHGLTLAGYLQVALRQPSLLCQSPDTVIANVEGAAGRFARHGLTLGDYLRAAIRQPQLYHQSPATVAANVEGVAAAFAPAGLTLPFYLRAAARHPPLFCLRPATVIANVRGVADRYGPAGLDLAGYLQACLRQPPLICLRPETVAARIDRVIEMHERGLVRFPRGGGGPEQPLRPLFDYLVRNQTVLCYSEENLALRLDYALASGERPAGAGLLTRRRHRVERDLARALARGEEPPSA